MTYQYPFHLALRQSACDRPPRLGQPFVAEIKIYIKTCDSPFKRIRLKNKKQIYIGGLDGDYKQEPFKMSRLFDLIPYATTVTKLTAKCVECNDIAPFTKRIIKSNQQILVGGSDSYKPVCLNHL